MSSIVRSGLLFLIVSLLEVTAFAQGRAPQILREPVFGLRYDVEKADFEILPDDEIRKCPTLADDAHMRSRTWVYASTQDKARRYYVIGGYSIRSTPRPPVFPRYELNRYGTVIQIEGDDCTVFGPAREVFDARYFDEIPQLLLERLAFDLSIRLTRAFGGAERLQSEFRRQRIDLTHLSPELRKAFAAGIDGDRRPR